MKKISEHINHAGLLLKRARNNLMYGNQAKISNPTSLTTEEIEKYNQHRYYGAQKYICLAPFNSLFLSIDGNVYACNLNRKFILGNIRDVSLNEIWSGAKLSALRNYIADGDLSKGCEKCQFNISTGNYDASTSSHYDYVGFNNSVEYPIRMDFEISNICNLGCVMCSPLFSSTIQKDIRGKKLSKNFYNTSILADLKNFIPHLKFMNFSGGEPFMNNLYYDIWELIPELNKNCKAHIQTNGTILNEKVKTILNKHPFNIGISIDSLKKETYNSIRLFSDYEIRQENLSYFTNYCHTNKTTLTYSFCLLRQNAAEIPDFVDYANKHNAVLYLSPVFEPYEHSIRNLPIEELQSLKAQFLSCKFNSTNDIQTKNIIHFRQFTEQIDSWIAFKQQKTAYLAANKFTESDIHKMTINKLNNYFTEAAAISGEKVADADECIAFIDQLFTTQDEQKINILNELLLENEERIYNQLKYYWM